MDEPARLFDIEDFKQEWNPKQQELDLDKLQSFVLDLCQNSPQNKKQYSKIFHQLTRKNKIVPSKHYVNVMYQSLLRRGCIQQNGILEDLICKKKVRSLSGVLVVTVVMRPDEFSCPNNCFYCPNETIANGAKVDMPRSYASTEPAVMRAMQHDFDTARQVWDRLKTLENNGHKIDKMECINLGGTFSSYPRKYQEEHCRDIFYAANTYFDVERRERLSLVEEQRINENCKCKVIGISLETRPDRITLPELLRFRKFGCTRVQIGVQHTHNDVLEFVNRGHTVEDSIRAITLLKDCGFKVDIHLMPDLPSTTPEKDKDMITTVLETPDFQPDYLKLYPCLDVRFTVIREWKKEGKWRPYAEEDKGEKLKELLIYTKSHIHEWTRINRVQRDFPSEDHGAEVGYTSKNITSNLRQEIMQEMGRRGVACRCIRCRECKEQIPDLNAAHIVVRTHEASGGTEHFISMENDDESVLYGFVRLRLKPDLESTKSSGQGRRGKILFPELVGAGLIRELHVYGALKAVYEEKTDSVSQHSGFGRRLMEKAEELAVQGGFSKLAVISGVGVRNYYRKLGYELEGTYMTKALYPHGSGCGKEKGAVEDEPALKKQKTE
eukprot:GCRY01004276.1.p1 GENE.GCRY01004276.1~~GCRY01004276.1.p1  ORF type:complete len:609 (+),score=165.57 GCRY01004276.1:164-1990(+)